ncbi:MAG: bifunctional riboflavin kinase/FAD synthetase [Candidatus Omnitrophota bacterium]
MKVLYGYKNLQGKLKDPVVAIGIFDGIHIGHKRVIKKVLSAKKSAQESVILTFDPHPQITLRPDKTPPRIMSLEHRLFIFEKMGIDAAIVIRFTDFIASMTPEDFIKKVICVIGAKKIYVGINFHFGSARSGNVEIFKKIARDYGIDVCTVRPVKLGRRVVSSTWLRKLICRGKIEKAETLLRRPVSILGRVVVGARRGKTIGIPTANIDPCQETIPPPGVYAVKIDIGCKFYDGVINIGFNPTFYGKRLKRRKEPQIEAHLIGFRGDLYGSLIEIFFIKKIRKEKTFKGEENLKKQIEKDIGKAEKILLNKKILMKIKRYKYCLQK